VFGTGCTSIAISNGLSFNKKTGTISGVPIVASDPVIYTVTAIGRRGQDTATVVITSVLDVLLLENLPSVLPSTA
jgi:hypothetical protein